MSTDTDEATDSTVVTSTLSVEDKTDADSEGSDSDPEDDKKPEDAATHRVLISSIVSQSSRSVRDMMLKKREQQVDPWPKMRECLLLLLQSRMKLREMVERRVKQERFKAGELSVFEIQSLLRSYKEGEEDNTDWVTEIQELKRNLVTEVRRNHVLEKDLVKLDSRISLLIKHRNSLDFVQPKRKTEAVVEKKSELLSDPRKLEHYQNLFYLLQTEPRYLAKLVYLMSQDNVETFLDTILLALYGDSFSPREESLILSLLKQAIQLELKNAKSIGDITKAESVLPKILVSYNKRKLGTEYIQGAFPTAIKTAASPDVPALELNPVVAYQAMISDIEVKTGQKSTMDRSLPEDKIMELPEVKALLASRVQQLTTLCQLLFDTIVQSMSKMPYGLRLICKIIQQIGKEQFHAQQDDIYKVLGYYVYYRFINLAIVTPDLFNLADRNMSLTCRKNLVQVGKVLQNLFAFNLFSKTEKGLVGLNDWLTSHFSALRRYFKELTDVPEPDDFLQVDKYMELTQKTKPLIIISIREIVNTHKLVQQHLDHLIKGKEDPLIVIAKDLGSPPPLSAEDEREIQLTLVNRFSNDSISDVSTANDGLLAETKELLVNILKLVPLQTSGEKHGLTDFLRLAKQHANEKDNAQLNANVTKVSENLQTLENVKLVSKDDDFAGFLKQVALEVVNRNVIRDQQRKEVKRLTQALRNLKKHQTYLNEQITQYNDYLRDCLQHFPSGSTKPVKFSYSKLSKKGVIIDSEVPAISRRKCNFIIGTNNTGSFDIEAKIAGISVDRLQLSLDDLLDRHANNITRLELDQVTLDVNMTIHLLNENFLKHKK